MPTVILTMLILYNIPITLFTNSLIIIDNVSSNIIACSRFKFVFSNINPMTINPLVAIKLVPIYDNTFFKFLTFNSINIIINTTVRTIDMFNTIFK